MNNIIFESPIEQMIYPIIYTLSIKYNLRFTYQKKIGFQSGYGMTQEEYFEERGWKYTERSAANYDWDDNYWSCEKYRIDFTLESSKMKIAIEIDGEPYHQNKIKDKNKDDYLIHEGYTVLRFTAKEVVKNINKIKERISNLILQNEIGFIIEKPKEPIKEKIIPRHTLDYFSKTEGQTKI